jgi:hypothetical protein
MVFTHPDVIAGVKIGTVLTYYNRAGRYELAAGRFQTHPLASAVPAVSRAPA